MSPYSYLSRVRFAEINRKDVYNIGRLEKILHIEVSTVAIDKIPEKTSPSFFDDLKLKSQSRAGGIVNCLTLKKGARVMLTVNVEVTNCLINSQLGTINNFKNLC